MNPSIFFQLKRILHSIHNYTFSHLKHPLQCYSFRTSPVFTVKSWTIVGEIPTIDFTEEVILQPYFIYDPSNIIPKENDYVVC